MGVLTDKHFSATGTEKCSVSSPAAAEQQKNQLQLVKCPVVVQTPYPTSAQELESLEDLKRLINENEDVRDSGVELDDEFLLAFVRGKRNDSHKAFKTFQNYVQIRKVKYTKFFQTVTPRHFQYILEDRENRFCGLLRHTDREGRCVGVGLASMFNPRLHKVDDCIEAFVISGLELLRTDNAPRNGLVLVIDASGFGLRHAREFTMSRIYMFLQIFLSSYPVKYKGFHILNNGYIFDTILKLIKTLIPKKLRERIHLHGSNYESLYKHVPREILPQKFGGPLTDDEAFNLEFESTLTEKTEYYEKMATNW